VRDATIFAGHRSARWLVPVGVLGVVGVVIGGVLAARATPDPLPETTTTQLLADIQTSPVDGFSGTMVAQLSLGLPSLPGLATGDESTSMASLLSGSHTVRVWYGGPDQQRLALLGSTSESDLFHSGSDLWEWDSDSHVATHTVLPSASRHGSGTATATPTPLASLTPDQLAAQLLAHLDPSTKVSLGNGRTVADRSAYDLVLTPRASNSKVGSVHVAVDGDTKLPLAVEVYPRGSHTAALDVAYTDISFTMPPSSYFTFTPPPGATVHTGTGSPATDPITGAGEEKLTRVNSTGSGWATVVQYRTDPAQLTKNAGPTLSVLPKVSGTWGSGRLLDGSLFSVLVTDNGRVFAGAVDPSALYAAASAH
jgi:outer membrane lipoprotein-sorting protein